MSGGRDRGSVSAPLHGAALTRSLEDRFRTALVSASAGPLTLEVLKPANSDDLITEEDFVRDERLPYWADIWPSSLVLASHVRTLHGAGHRLLELGCGLGLVSTAAVLAGFDVVATDYYDDALLFAEANVWRNAARPLGTRMVDWRELPPDLGCFDVVVASDVLYERLYATLIADALALTLEPGGVGLIADPGRIAAPAFVTECAERGLVVAQPTRVPWAEGSIRQTIDILRVERRR